MIALEEGDAKLARGHFGRAYELGLRALEAAGNPRPLPYDRNGNKPFFEAAKGLVHCLVATGKIGLAKDVVARANALDPSDPLALARLLATPRTPSRRKPS
jgi:hypothetical protein